MVDSLPVVWFQMRIVSSAPPEASTWPLPLRATAVTGPAWPGNWRSTWPVARVQTRTILSALPVGRGGEGLGAAGGAGQLAPLRAVGEGRAPPGFAAAAGDDRVAARGEGPRRHRPAVGGRQGAGGGDRQLPDFDQAVVAGTV